MQRSKTWRQLVTPAGWGEVAVDAAKVAVVAFIVLQLKEWFDAGSFDTSGTAADAALIAGGILVLNAVLTLLKR